MRHQMNLRPEPFSHIKEGRKNVEMRLFDERRALIQVGDEIEFTNTENGEHLTVLVVGLARYRDFEELYSHYDQVSIGYTETDCADPADMYLYYPPEKVEQYGTLAIEIKVISA